MRPRYLLSSLTVLALTAGACSSGGGVHVTTTTAPNADLADLHTFRVLTAPQRRADAPALPADDPMLSNSITNQRLRTDLLQGIEQKGFTVTQNNPDFLVAYYAGTKAKMDTTYWAPDYGWRYGYRRFGFGGAGFRSAWPWYGYASPYPNMQVNEYTQGSVIVDVIDPKTMELIWRGQGLATVSSDPARYNNELDKSVSSILKDFPFASQSH
jgi:hypothetical protein